MIRVVDNFLSHSDFLSVRNTLVDSNFPWFWKKFVVDENDDIEEKNKVFNSFFMHHFFLHGNRVSHYADCLNPLLAKLDMLSLIAARANFYFPAERLIVHGYHLDMMGEKKESLSKVSTGVYYLDDSDGKTVFEDGTEVQSKENRICFFPGDMYHSSTNCTNNKNRLIVNVSYISR